MKASGEKQAEANQASTTSQAGVAEVRLEPSEASQMLKGFSTAALTTIGRRNRLHGVGKRLRGYEVVEEGAKSDTSESKLPSGGEAVQERHEGNDKTTESDVPNGPPPSHFQHGFSREITFQPPPRPTRRTMKRLGPPCQNRTSAITLHLGSGGVPAQKNNQRRADPSTRQAGEKLG
ncbi:hypothetical protein D4764_01G0020450 [Takifugu flavidus]|uniref:Uncharacterized protein n=1 Tax=Takifugu flavidus TaxID=433684 RepID=A0A5C6PUE6_9TELE|nr:hypothetical protein D4764_01G0020450 [Takifugu flavidus]